MKIELRNVKYAAWQSEETSCFRATVYIDGRRACEVSNDGHGGCNFWDDRAVQQRLDDFARETMPVIVASWTDPQTGKPGEIQPDADWIVEDLLADAVRIRDLRRMLSSHIVTSDGRRIMRTKRLTKDRLASLLADPNYRASVEKDGERILNLLPFDEAFAIVKAIEMREAGFPQEQGR